MAEHELRILLVEDDDGHAMLVEASLARFTRPIRIIRVRDGIEAMEYLRGLSDGGADPAPDLVLLDLKLPRADGLDVLAAVKADRLLRRIPTVVLTTSDAESDRSRAYELHANAYLVKPSRFQDFHRMMSDVAAFWATWNVPAASL